MKSYLHHREGGLLIYLFVCFLLAERAPASPHTHTYLHTAFLNAAQLTLKLQSDALSLLPTSVPLFAARIILLIASRAVAAVSCVGMKVVTQELLNTSNH